MKLTMVAVLTALLSKLIIVKWKLFCYLECNEQTDFSRCCSFV